jgi:hypothetical protein
VVEFLNFDALKHTIILNVKIIENKGEEKFEIVFNGVSAYYFIENSENKRLSPTPYDEGDYLELTSISYFEFGVGKVAIESYLHEWTKKYYSSANFALELWSSMLFIEAKSVVVNGEVFETGYPKIEGW